MSYYNVAEVESATANLAATYPSLAAVIDLPFATAEGRRSQALHLGGSARGANDAVVIIAGVHGAEWGSCEIVLNLAADLLEAYSLQSGLSFGGKTFSAQEVRDLLDLRDIVIFPLVNPDGRHCSQTEIGRELWRKNRNPAHARGDPELVGVDINRNFDFLFDLAAFAPGAGVSASNDATVPDYYQGPQAFSEPETRNVRALFDAVPKARWFIDIHCTGQTIHHVWSDDEVQHVDPTMNFRNPAFDGLRGTPAQGYREFLDAADLASMRSLSQRFVDDLKAVRGTQYDPGPAFELTPFSGTSHDYAYARHLCDSNQGKVLGFVVEWGSFDCQPMWSEMEQIVAEVTAGLIGFCIATQ